MVPLQVSTVKSQAANNHPFWCIFLFVVWLIYELGWLQPTTWECVSGHFFPIRDNHDFSIVVERNPHQYRCMSLSQNLDFGGEKKRGDFTIILIVDGSIPLFERSNA